MHTEIFRKLMTTVCFLFILQLGNAQMKLENRIEFELKNGYSNEKIYKSLKGYFVLEARADKKEQNKFEIKYDLYNGDLQQVNTSSVFIPTDMREDAVYNDDTCIYKMYRNSKLEFILSRVRIDGLNTFTQKGKLPKGIDLIDMKVVGSKAWFEARLKKMTCLLQVNINSGECIVSEFIEKKWDKKTSIVNYQMVPQSGELLVFLNKYIKKGSCELSQVKVNGSCELCDNIQLTGTGDKVISSVSACRMADNIMVYTGTYSAKNQNLSEGLFFAEAEGNKLNYINYVNFLDMDNFLSYMGERKQNKILKKKNSLEQKGKEYSINYYIAAHDIIVLPEGYLLVGEAYYPTYISVPHTTFTMMNGMSMPQTYYSEVFDGYEYSHAFVARFSKVGKLLWDQCFAMNPLERPYYVKRFIKISEQTDKKIGMIFTSGNFIVSKIIDFDGHVEKDETRELISTGKDSEKTNWTASNADYWFGNNFLVYGSQRVKNNEEKSNRKVFFVNKISF